MIELLHYLLNQILGEDTKIKITEEEKEHEILLNLEIPEKDRPLIIGRGGVNIKAIRTLVSIIARRENKRVYIKIID